MNRLQTLILSSLGFGILAVTGSFLFNIAEGSGLVLLFLMGIGIGLLVAPVFTPEHFKSPLPLQTTSGAFAGFFGFLALSSSVTFAFLGAAVGAIVGVTAPFWSKRVDIS